jgi:anti-sigma factor RsiW
MSACDRPALHALLDGELDAAHALAIETHAASCPACAAELRRLAAVREALRTGDARHPAPPALAQRIEAMIAPARAPRRVWPAGLLGAALAASLMLVIGLPILDEARFENELVAGHVRSLLAAHLTDVASSDKHTVKPWFNGKVDFSPPAPDLAQQGFPLAGGRLDYLAGKVTPALVYRRRLHVINVFVRNGGAGLAGLFPRGDGYNLAAWREGGLSFYAVSDVAAGDLAQFKADFQAATK